MAKCHQCNSEDLTNSRTGKCGVCFTDDVQFCQKCAMWELGPMDSDDRPEEAIKVAPPREIPVPRREDGEGDEGVAVVAELPIGPEAFLTAMKGVCPYLKDQLENEDATLYGKAFKDYAKSAIEKFQELYPSCKFDRLALQILFVFHLSSQERVQCRDKKDAEGASSSAVAKPVKRWQTREIAHTHLEHHLAKIEEVFGVSVRTEVAKPAYLLALARDDLEYWIKQLKSPTLTAIDLKAAAGSGERARETLEIWLILYQVFTTTRAKGDLANHWTQKVDPANFSAYDALGVFSTQHYEFLYGDAGDGSAFSPAALAEIRRLWTVLNDARAENRLPGHPRYPDPDIDRHNLLQPVEKHYLQYLPRFDKPHSQMAQRTACEQIVRDRVRGKIREYRNLWLNQMAADNRTAYYIKAPIDFEEFDLAGTSSASKTVVLREVVQAENLTLTFEKPRKGKHVRDSITEAEMARLQTFMTRIQNPDQLRRQHGRIKIRITNEMGNKRRTSRRKAVKDAMVARMRNFSANPALVDDDGAPVAWNGRGTILLDDFYARMRNEFFIDQAFDKKVANLAVGAAEQSRDFPFKGWFPLKAKNVLWSTLFPDCGFDQETIETLDEHYARVEGTSARPAHYTDWRNHKDHWLYDCFNLDQTRRPLFATLSVQKSLPELNANYGTCAVYYDQARINSRCIYTLGDKQQPRRSMLLLLDTLFFGRPKKEGTVSQSSALRQPVIADLMRRYDYLTSCFPGAPLAEQWEATMNWDKKVPYPTGDLIIECQIFGPVSLGSDVSVFVYGDIADDGGEPQNVIDARRHITAYHRGVTFLFCDRGKRMMATSLNSADAARADILEDDLEAFIG